MEIIWIAFVFVCGFAISLIGLPPMVGFLVAGFALNWLQIDQISNLDVLANLGITLMLFTIGLKLDFRQLIKQQVWIGGVSHIAIWIVSCSGLLWLLLAVTAIYVEQTSWQQIIIVAFALSFSSTVCAVKLLENKPRTKHPPWPINAWSVGIARHYSSCLYGLFYPANA